MQRLARTSVLLTCGVRVCVRPCRGLGSWIGWLFDSCRYACTLGDRQTFVNLYVYWQWPLLIANLALLAVTYAVRKKSPLNLLMLTVWTSTMSVSMGAVTAAFVEEGNTDLLFEVRTCLRLVSPLARQQAALLDESILLVCRHCWD